MELMEFGLLQEDVTSIYSDNGVLWMGGLDIGTYRTGLTVFNWRENEFDYVETSSLTIPVYDDINCIFGNHKYIFVGSDNGVLMIDKKNRTVDDRLYETSALPGRQVLSLFSLGDSLFIGTNFGLGLIDLSPDSASDGVTVILSPSEINAMLEIDDYLWVGTSNGTFRIDLISGEVGRMNLSNYAARGEILDIEKNRDMIWIATYDELVSINSKTAETEVYAETIRYGGARALAINDSLVAAATRDGLLLLWAGKKPRTELYTMNDGLLSNDIRDVVIDGEYLWIGTDRGLTRFWLNSPSIF